MLQCIWLKFIVITPVFFLTIIFHLEFFFMECELQQTAKCNLTLNTLCAIHALI
jgi:hypothetical protein